MLEFVHKNIESWNFERFQILFSFADRKKLKEKEESPSPAPSSSYYKRALDINGTNGYETRDRTTESPTSSSSITQVNNEFIIS